MFVKMMSLVLLVGSFAFSIATQASVTQNDLDGLTVQSCGDKKDKDGN